MTEREELIAGLVSRHAGEIGAGERHARIDRVHPVHEQRSRHDEREQKQEYDAYDDDRQLPAPARRGRIGRDRRFDRTAKALFRRILRLITFGPARARRQRRKIRRGRGVLGFASRALRGAGVFFAFRRSLALAALLPAERLRRGLRFAGHGFAGFPVGGIVALADDLRIGRIFIVFGIPRSLRLFVREEGVILVVTDDGYRLSLFAAFACVSSYTARTPSASGPSVPLPQTPRGSTGLR